MIQFSLLLFISRTIAKFWKNFRTLHMFHWNNFIILPVLRHRISNCLFLWEWICTDWNEENVFVMKFFRSIDDFEQIFSRPGSTLSSPIIANCLNVCIPKSVIEELKYNRTKVSRRISCLLAKCRFRFWCNLVSPYVRIGAWLGFCPSPGSS